METQQVGVVLFNHGTEVQAFACPWWLSTLASASCQDFSVAIGDRVAQLILEMQWLHLFLDSCVCAGRGDFNGVYASEENQHRRLPRSGASWPRWYKFRFAQGCRAEHVFVVTSVARTFRSRFEVPSRVRRAKARERKVELASFRFFGNVRAMAGSWGGHTASSEELWSSLFTVVHADWADLRPLLDRFDLDDLVTLTCAAGLTTRPQSTPSTKATPKTCVSQR